MHLYHTAIPFKFDVFDCRKTVETKELPTTTRKSSILAVMTKETLRARVEEKNKSCVMLVIDTMWQIDVPYRIYLEGVVNEDTEAASDTKSTFCISEDGKVLFPKKQDIVEEVLSQFYALPNLDRRTIWRDRALETLAGRHNWL